MMITMMTMMMKMIVMMMMTMFEFNRISQQATQTGLIKGFSKPPLAHIDHDKMMMIMIEVEP